MAAEKIKACMNEDDTNFYVWNDFTNYGENELRTLIDHYDMGGIDQIMFCVNAKCTSYASAVHEMYGSKTCKAYETDSGCRKLFDNVRGFANAGINPYKVWLAESRKRGISPWISVRMNDIHEPFDEDHFLHSEFWRNHPELRRIQHRPAYGWTDKSLDFCHEEVREYMMALITEVLEIFDLDGIEVDWMRFYHHFAPGREEEGRQITLEMHRRIRQLADAAAERLGHPVGVAIRVPATPEHAWELGFDVPTLSREHLVDIVIPTAFFTTTDTGMPISLWRAILAPETRLYAGIEICVKAGMHNAHALRTTPSIVRSQCAS